MPGLKDHLKKVCKKQSKKFVRKQLRQGVPDQPEDLSKKARKKWAGRLAKLAYKEVVRQAVIPTDKHLRQEVKKTLARLVDPGDSRNDAQFCTKPEPAIQPVVVLHHPQAQKAASADGPFDPRKPYKKKPCSSCPALSNGLCRCARKNNQRAIKLKAG